MSALHSTHLISFWIGLVCFTVCCSARRRIMPDNELPPGCTGLGSAADCKARCGEQNYAWRCSGGHGECTCQNPDAMPGKNRNVDGNGDDPDHGYSGPDCAGLTSADCQAKCGGPFKWRCDMGKTICDCPKPSYRGFDGPVRNNNEFQQNLPAGYGDCSHKQKCESICGEYKHYKCNASYGETCECMEGSPNAGKLIKYWGP